MSCSIRKTLSLSVTAGVFAAGALLAPASAQATTVQPEEPVATNAEVSPISHLVLHPGSDETALNFNWFTSSPVTEQVQIAPAAAQTSAEFPVEAAAVFEATMTPGNDRGLTTAKATATHLEADTQYIYRVGSQESGWSSTFQYSSPSAEGGFHFNFYGDAQLGSGGSGYGEGSGLDQDAQGWYNTLETSTEMYPDASFLFHAGDQIDGYHDEGPLEEWLGDRDPQYDAFLAEPADVLREIPLAVLSGNHDDPGWTYDEYWNMPNAQDRNYWYTHDNALIIGLDTNTTSIEDMLPLMSLPEDEVAEAYAQAMAEQRPGIIATHQELLDYVKTVINEQGADAKWIIVGFHQSPFSQAYHGQDDFDIQLMREEGFTQGLSDAGVDLVLGGHDHIYTRTHLLEGNDPVIVEVDDGTPLPKQEGQTMYLTGTSSSGSKYYDFMDSAGVDDPELVDYDSPLATTAAWNQDYKPGFSNIAVDGSELTIRTHHSDDGALIDEVTLAKGLPAENEDTGLEDTGQDNDGATDNEDHADEQENPTNTEDDITEGDDTGDREEDETPGDDLDGDDKENDVTPVVDTASNDDNLAFTGSTTLPIVIAAATLLAAGGTLLFWARRRKV